MDNKTVKPLFWASFFGVCIGLFVSLVLIVFFWAGISPWAVKKDPDRSVWVVSLAVIVLLAMCMWALYKQRPATQGGSSLAGTASVVQRVAVVCFGAYFYVLPAMRAELAPAAAVALALPMLLSGTAGLALFLFSRPRD